MRVLHVFWFYEEGLGYEENHLPFAQASRGIEASLVTSTYGFPNWGKYRSREARAVFEAGSIVDRKVLIHRLVPAFHLRTRNVAQVYLKGLRDFIAHFEPDIIHLHTPTGLVTVQALKVARALQIPVVIDFHLWYFNLRPIGSIRKTYYELFRRVILPYYSSTIARFIPLGPEPQEILSALFGVPKAKMAHSTLGADTIRFSHDERARNEIRAGLGIPKDAIVLTFVGRINPGKEIQTLIEAWVRLADIHDVFLMIVGPSSQQADESLMLSVPPNLRHRLIVTGFVPNHELPRHMSASDIGVWPGDPGITTIEAMSCRMAVVHSEPVAGRHLTMYGNGRAFHRGQTESLTQVLHAMLVDRKKLTEMRFNSRRLVEDIYDWNIVAQRTERIYEDVLNGTNNSVEIWNPVIR